MLKIAIVIPAYNEEKSIATVVEGINNLQFKNFIITPIVINDCSQDNTEFICRQLLCVLISSPINLGIGGAVQLGFRYAIDNNYDYALQVDGDGQHPAEEIGKFVKFIENIEESEWDIIIGSRFLSKEGFKSSFARRCGIVYFKFLLKLITGYVITDATSGFRMLNRKVLELVAHHYPDDYPEPESIIMYNYHKFKIQEISVNMKHREGGKSSITFLTSVYYMVKVTISIMFTFFRRNY